MKFFKQIIGLLLFFTCMGSPAEAKVIHQDMCQMSTAYEDQMYKIADFEKGAFKGRFALMDGQCSGHTSYMAIVTYYHGGVKTTFLNDERIQKMKHVQVGEVLANQKGSMDEMKLEAKEWSLPGFKIVVDEEWADYVRPDLNFVMSERGDA